MRRPAAVLPDYLTEREARARLRVSRSTFRRMRDRRDIRTYRIRGTTIVRFKREDVDALLVDGEDKNTAQAG